MTEHALDSDQAPAAVLRAVGEAAELWGASWQPGGRGGRLELPVVAGLRRGVLTGELQVEPTAGGSRLHLREEHTRHHLNLPALAILGMGGAGGGVAALWPFFPGLLALAPVGLVLAVVAWLLVASRLRSSGPQEFLELVAGMSDGDGGGSGPSGPDTDPSSDPDSAST